MATVPFISRTISPDSDKGSTEEKNEGLQDPKANDVRIKANNTFRSIWVDHPERQSEALDERVNPLGNIGKKELYIALSALAIVGVGIGVCSYFFLGEGG